MRKFWGSQLNNHHKRYTNKSLKWVDKRRQKNVFCESALLGHKIKFTHFKIILLKHRFSKFAMHGH